MGSRKLVTQLKRTGGTLAAAFVMSFTAGWVACAPVPEDTRASAPPPSAPITAVAVPAPTSPDFGLPPLPQDEDASPMTPEKLIRHLSQGDAKMKAALEEAEAQAPPSDADSQARMIGIQRRAIAYANERQEFDTPEEHAKRALELEHAGYGPEALVHYQKATAKDPSNAIAWAGVGRMLAYTGKPEEALGAYAKALALAPERPGWLKEMGQVLESQGKLDEALAAYRKAIALKPDFGEAYLRMAVTQWRRKDLAAAREALDRAKALGVTPPQGFENELREK